MVGREAENQGGFCLESNICVPVTWTNEILSVCVCVCVCVCAFFLAVHLLNKPSFQVQNDPNKGERATRIKFSEITASCLGNQDMNGHLFCL